MNQGKVWLVGAGPSDAELLTVKAKRVLEQAEVVVYDRLVGDSILLMMPESAEKIDAGKRSGNHTMPQEEMNCLLLKKAQEGKRVVRLKGGDPFLFGRGGEELTLLAEHGIPFEVVPGVTSAIAVAAYNGIPITHRDFASSVHIITGHKKKDEPLELDFDTLAKLEGTLVFLMGVSALEDICGGLMGAGKAKETPAALLSRGTTSRQDRVVSTLEKLADDVKAHPLMTPAIIVIGEVCALSGEFAWYEKLPLFGRKIIVTRPKERMASMAARLRSLGAEVLELPTIAIAPCSAETLPERGAVLENLDCYQYLVFTSPSGVDCFFDLLRDNHLDIRRFSNGKIAVIGAGTAAQLQKYGLLADLMPETYDAAHLGRCIGADCKDGDRILIPRARAGSQELVEEITKQKKVTIADLPIYDTIEKENPVLELPNLTKEDATVVFTSASTLRGFAKMTSGADYSHLQAVCIGVQTKAAAENAGFSNVIVAKEATVKAIVSAIEEQQ